MLWNVTTSCTRLHNHTKTKTQSAQKFNVDENRFLFFRVLIHFVFNCSWKEQHEISLVGNTKWSQIDLCFWCVYLSSFYDVFKSVPLPCWPFLNCFPCRVSEMSQKRKDIQLFALSKWCEDQVGLVITFSYFICDVHWNSFTTHLITKFKAHSHRTKAKIFFGVCRLFMYLFLLVLWSCFASAFAFVWCE